jgi:hypothetical protein
VESPNQSEQMALTVAEGDFKSYHVAMARPPGCRRPVEQRTRDALIRSHGNLTLAAEILRCSRQNVDKTIDRYPDLQKLCADILQEEIDKHEGTLRKMALEKEVPVAVLAFLNAKAQNRGWGYTSRTDVVVSGSVEHKHLHLHAEKYAQLSDEELAQLIADRRAALRSADEQKLIDVTPAKD